MSKAYNKGEWSELYAFIKLLKDGRIYAADEKAERINDVFLPIIKIIREEQANEKKEFYTGATIKIFLNGNEIKSFDSHLLDYYIGLMLPKIFTGSRNNSSTGAFQIDDMDQLMDDLGLRQVKASSGEKVDIQMQIHDINTGYSPDVGFSIKSDVGSPPTLLNPGKNTRFRYKITGLSDEQIREINAIDKTVEKEYMKARMSKLIEYADDISMDCMLDSTYEDNLIMIDSALPQIYGEMILQHYLHINEGIYNCNELVDLVAQNNPMNYRRKDNYRYKIKKLLVASALGMTPGKAWDGMEAATGGYIIIKKDGDILCYHLYNRNYFEEYLINNTRFDRPSATRYDFGYVFKEGSEAKIDLNVQVRFKPIK